MHIQDKSLNKKQQEAVNHEKGPLLIIAGAGTGKTTVITERIKHLILEKSFNPRNILALTFTEKASKEMEERVDVVMPYGCWDMWISTFHGFCEKILRSYAFHIGYDSSFKLMSEVDALAFVRKNLYKFKLSYFRPLGNPNKFIYHLIKHFSRLQDEDINPKQYMNWVLGKIGELGINLEQLIGLNKDKISKEEIEIQKWHELASAYEVYESLKVEENVMDFGDLITKTLKLFRERPNILDLYRLQFAQILVDEFQDTNVAQYELLKLLAPPDENPNIVVVGDDSQSIYKFRGAAISNILHFMDDYPTAKTIVLTENYRSTQTILDVAYRLIQHNNPDTLEAQLGIQKRLTSTKNVKEENDIEFFHLPKDFLEAEKVADEIQKLTGQVLFRSKEEDKKKKINYSDIAILVRAKAHAEIFIKALSKRGIPYHFHGPSNLFDQKEVNFLISYLRVLKDQTDDNSWFNLLTSFPVGISLKDMTLMLSVISKKNINLIDFFNELDNDKKLSEETKYKVRKITSITNKHLETLQEKSAGEILFDFVQELKIFEQFLNDNYLESLNKAQNITNFFEKIISFESQNKVSGVFSVLEWIDLVTEIGEAPISYQNDYVQENAVNIMTVHSAKGLEFPVVFLVNLVNERFPSRDKSEQIPIPDNLIKETLPKGEFHIQEERRLFYVGITRAKDKLYFTASDFYGDGVRKKKISPFVFEALGDSLSEENINISNSNYPEITIQKLNNLSKSLRENDTLSEKFCINYLSYSQIECFDTCPLHYKLRYIVKLPSPPSASASFGISIHETLKEIYLNAKNGLTVNEDFALRILHKNWRREGYVNRDHLQETLEAGEKYIKNYIKKNFDKKMLPLVLEQSFTVKLPERKGNKPLKIGGKIDRIDKLSDGKIEIIDYKTGSKIPSQKEVDKDMQLTFYALACVLINDHFYPKDPKDIILSLYYFDGDQKISTIRTKEQLEDAIDKIYSKRKEIENSDFKCNNNFFCKNCEYKKFCKTEE